MPNQWDDESATITFDTGSGRPVTLVDEMVVAVGGSVLAASERGGEPEMPIGAELWVSAPRDSCDDTEIWAVSAVTVLGEPPAAGLERAFDPPTTCRTG